MDQEIGRPDTRFIGWEFDKDIEKTNTNTNRKQYDVLGKVGPDTRFIKGEWGVCHFSVLADSTSSWDLWRPKWKSVVLKFSNSQTLSNFLVVVVLRMKTYNIFQVFCWLLFSLFFYSFLDALASIRPHRPRVATDNPRILTILQNRVYVRQRCLILCISANAVISSASTFSISDSNASISVKTVCSGVNTVMTIIVSSQ